MSGNVLVGQSGGPTSVINASLLGVVSASLESEDIDKVYGMRFGIEGFLEGRILDFDRVSRHQLDLLRETPSSALGSCRYKLREADLPRVFEAIEALDVRYLFMIGGNDTMDTIHRVEGYCREKGYDLHGIGVPKTVDNDLFGTDHTPGYPSAARYVALSVAQSGRLARDMQRVDKFVVHQTVGRDAGWLAASSAIARRNPGDAPHIIVMPERPLEPEGLLEAVEATIRKNGWAYIVVGEGARWSDGKPISAARGVDDFSNIEFGAMSGSSAAISLHARIAERTGFRGEFQVTESLPMCAADRTSPVDREEAYLCGVRAVERAVGGDSGNMVAIDRVASSPYRVEYGRVPLSKVAERTKPLPDGFISSDGLDVTDAFLAYLRPLVGPLPTYAELGPWREPQ